MAWSTPDPSGANAVAGGSRAAASLPPLPGRYCLWTAPARMNTCPVVQALSG